MEVGGDAIEWDFLTLVTLWNLYGLPLLLAVVAIGVLIRRHLTSSATAGLDGPRTVRLIALIQFALALRSWFQLTQELVTMRTMGVTESFASIITYTVGSFVNPLLALGLRHRPPRGRRWAISWYAFWSLIAVKAMHWRWRFSVQIDPARWPDDLVGYGLPLLLLGVMLMPRIKRVFAAEPASPPAVGSQPADADRVPAAIQNLSTTTRPRWTIVSLVCLLLLIVLISTLVVDVTDWVRRLIFEPE